MTYARQPVRSAAMSAVPHGDVEPGHRHARQPEASGRDETLMAADDGSVIPTGEDGLDEAELAQAALEGVEFVLADPAWVGRIRVEVVESDEFDCDGRERAQGSGHAVKRDGGARPCLFVPSATPAAEVLGDVAQEPENDDAREPRNGEQDGRARSDQPANRPEGRQEKEQGRQGDRPEDEQDGQRPMQKAVALQDVDGGWL
jgi:hypothetical protein